MTCFDQFLCVFDKTFDKDAPFKQVNMKEEKEALKPQLATGIKKSIKVRGKLYKEMVKDREVHEEKEKSLKNTEIR